MSATEMAGQFGHEWKTDDYTDLQGAICYGSVCTRCGGVDGYAKTTCRPQLLALLGLTESVLIAPSGQFQLLVVDKRNSVAALSLPFRSRGAASKRAHKETTDSRFFACIFDDQGDIKEEIGKGP